MRRLQQQGFTMLITLCTLVLLMVLGIGLFTLTSNSLNTSSHERNDQATYYIAEAGATLAAEKINALAEAAYQKAELEYKTAIKDEINNPTYNFNFSMEQKFYDYAEVAVIHLIQNINSNTNSNSSSIFTADFTETPNGTPKYTINIEQPDPSKLEYDVFSTGNIGDITTREVAKVVKIVFAPTNIKPVKVTYSNPSNQTQTNLPNVVDYFKDMFNDLDIQYLATKDTNNKISPTNGIIDFTKQDEKIFKLENTTSNLKMYLNKETSIYINDLSQISHLEIIGEGPLRIYTPYLKNSNKVENTILHKNANGDIVNTPDNLLIYSPGDLELHAANITGTILLKGAIDFKGNGNKKTVVNGSVITKSTSDVKITGNSLSKNPESHIGSICAPNGKWHSSIKLDGKGNGQTGNLDSIDNYIVGSTNNLDANYCTFKPDYSNTTPNNNSFTYYEYTSPIQYADVIKTFEED